MGARLAWIAFAALLAACPSPAPRQPGGGGSPDSGGADSGPIDGGTHDAGTNDAGAKAASGIYFVLIDKGTGKNVIKIGVQR